MPRIRTLKPSFWSSPEAAAMTRDARLLMLGLVSFSDDDGRFIATIPAIVGYVYPHDEHLPPGKVRAWLDETVTSGMVHLYRVSGLAYGCIPSWHKHQVIDRYTPSTLPAPDIECSPRETRVGRGRLVEPSTRTLRVIDEDSHQEGNRKGIGREGKTSG